MLKNFITSKEAQHLTFVCEILSNQNPKDYLKLI